MKKMMIACAAALAVFAAGAQDAAPVEREKPMMTPSSLTDQLRPGMPETFANGYAWGMTVATYKLMHILYSLNYSSLPVCVSTPTSNSTIANTLRDQINGVLIPASPQYANDDDWDRTAISMIAVASMQRFPCR